MIILNNNNKKTNYIKDEGIHLERKTIQNMNCTTKRCDADHASTIATAKKFKIS